MESAAASPSPRWHIGPIGFAYPEWRGNFYPRELAEADRLAFLTGVFNAVEINTTFYAIPSDDSVRRWVEATPESFRFSLKMPRDITHGPTPTGSIAAHTPPAGHLGQTETRELAERFLHAAAPLGPRFGALLLQFPPGFAPSEEGDLLAFLDAVFPAAHRPSGLHVVIELRHSGWFEPNRREAVRGALAARGMSWSAADEAPVAQAARPPAPRGGPPLIPNSSALYVRLLGKHKQFTDLTREQVDPTLRLNWWRERLRDAAAGVGAPDVYIFVNNDYSGHAPTTAKRITEALGIAPAGPGVVIPREPTLFD